MIVVDANIIAYLWIPGHEKYHCRELLIKDKDWWVPPLFKSEIRSVLLLHVRKKLLEMADAIQLLEKIELQFEYTTMEIPSQLIMALGNQTHCSAYDCEYVGLALLLGCPLITHDKKLLTTFSQLAMTPDSYLREI